MPGPTTQSAAKLRFEAKRRQITCHFAPPDYDALTARAVAAGTSREAIVKGDHEARERELAADKARAKATARKAASLEGQERDRQHRAALAAAARAATARERDAYTKGKAAADPALQAQHESDQLDLRRARAAFDAHADHRRALGQLVEQGLDFLGGQMTEPGAAVLYDRYGAIVHQQLADCDRQLDRALAPVMEADPGWLGRHEREVAAQQEAVIAEATDRIAGARLADAQVARCLGAKDAREELEPEITALTERATTAERTQTTLTGERDAAQTTLGLRDLAIEGLQAQLAELGRQLQAAQRHPFAEALADSERRTALGELRWEVSRGRRLPAELDAEYRRLLRLPEPSLVIVVDAGPAPGTPRRPLPPGMELLTPGRGKGPAPGLEPAAPNGTAPSGG